MQRFLFATTNSFYGIRVAPDKASTEMLNTISNKKENLECILYGLSSNVETVSLQKNFAALDKQETCIVYCQTQQLIFPQ